METQPSESEDQRNRTRRLQQICGLNGYVTYGVLEDHGIIDVISPLLNESENDALHSGSHEVDHTDYPQLTHSAQYKTTQWGVLKLRFY
jgi:hypothetical protein